MKLFDLLKNPIYRRCSKVIFLAAFLLFIYAIFFMPEKKVYSQTIMFSTMSIKSPMFSPATLVSRIRSSLTAPILIAFLTSLKP